MSTWSDALFALVWGVVGEFALCLLKRWNRARSITQASFLGLYAFFAFYAVGAVGVFQYFHRPLTYDLVTLVGNAAVMRSSVLERLTLPVLCALIFVPVAFLMLTLRFGRSRRATWIAAVFIAAWIALGYVCHRQYWAPEKMTHLWMNPHFELLRSTASRLIGAGRPTFPKDFQPGYVDEFRTFKARRLTQLSHFKLPPEVPRPRNAIIIVLESVGTKYLKLYGYPHEIMPNLTAESRYALLFDNIYAHASFTYCSVRTLNFSVYPGLPWHYALLGKGRPFPQTLAAAAKARGMRTAYFTSGDLYWEDQFWLLNDYGAFETLQGAPDLGCPLLSSWGAEDKCAIERLLGWVGEKPGEPFFAICWTDQTHDPYLLSPGGAPVDFFEGKPPPNFAGDLSRYLNVLNETDRQIGRVFGALRERGLAEDTLVVITGDHGEAFADPHPQRGHAWSVFEEEVHVPLLIWNPRLFPQGTRVQTIGGHVDFNPTLADILGMDPQAEWQGHSLFDPAHPGRAYFMAIAGGDIFGVREGDWKYAYDVTSGRESLFNLAIDPNEQRDLAASEPARCMRLRQRVAAWVTFEDAFLDGNEN